MDPQKNRLLSDLLGEYGEQRLGLHADAAHIQVDTTPHAAFLQAVRLCLQDPVHCNDTSKPSTGAGQL